MTNNTSSECCRICSATVVKDRLHPREMMFGMREAFSYVRCGNCGCLQLENVPASLEKFYPPNYYSYNLPEDVGGTFNAALKRRFIYPAMTRYRLGMGSISGRLLCKLRKGPNVPQWLNYLSRSICFHGGVLDIGCGAGMNLLVLRNCGFRNLLGVDPYIAKPLSFSGGIQIKKQDIHSTEGTFSLIMMHHVFEHLHDPLSTLKQAAKLLKPNGQILIRIPLADSYAAEKYRENWVQLDAPRHIFLHTRKSMETLAQLSGLKLVRVTYDSTDLQFWGSEQYSRDVPLFDPMSHMVNPSQSGFTPEQIERFIAEAERLNLDECGDQAAFVFEK